MKTEHDFLRHAVATVAYRAGKALRDAPGSFAGFRIEQSARTPEEILAHMGDLYDWALHLARGEKVWEDSEPLEWNEEVARFFAALEKFDAYLATGEPLGVSAEQLFQGPIADSLNHTGQLTMLRRLVGKPIRGENYSRADIVSGRVGKEQTPPKREFD